MWQPMPEDLQILLDMVTEAVSGTSNERQREIANKFDALSEDPNFVCYLLCILQNTNAPLNVRLAAGHSLKSAIDKAHSMEASHLEFLKVGLLLCMNDLSISRAVTSSVAALFRVTKGWVELIAYIVENLQASQPMLETLVTILEDVNADADLAHMFELDRYAECLKVLIPKLISLVEAQNTLAVKAMNQLLFLMVSSVIPFVAKYMDTLLILTNAQGEELHKHVSEGLLLYSTIRKDLVNKRFRDFAEYFLQLLNPPYVKTACDFWSEWLDYKDIILPYVERLLVKIVDNLKLSEQDLMDIMPDTQQFRYNKDEENISSWSERREAACLLDKLAHKLGPQCFLMLQGKLQNLLLNDSWENVESGLLGLGAIAAGSGSAIQPFLLNLLSFLLAKMEDSHPLVRSMAIWSTSRFTEYIIKTPHFQSYLQQIMKNIMYEDKLVQAAACTAFCVLVNCNPDELVTYLYEIVNIFGQVYTKYSGRSLLNLLDAIATLADTLGDSLKDPQIMNPLMAPLVSLWQATPDNDRLLWTLFETFTSMCLALGPYFSQYADEIFKRCARVLAQSIESEEKQFGMKALELAGAVIEIGCPLSDIVEFSQLVVRCLQDKDVGMRQYAAATFADLIIYHNSSVSNILRSVIPLLMDCISLMPTGPIDITELFVATSNNAICTIGEIAQRNPDILHPFVPNLLTILHNLIDEISNSRQFKGNLISVYGKLGIANPQALNSSLAKHLGTWCINIKKLPDAGDKASSLYGICLALKVDISVLRNYIEEFLSIIFQYSNIPNETLSEVRLILNLINMQDPEGMRGMLGKLNVTSEQMTRFNM